MRMTESWFHPTARRTRCDGCGSHPKRKTTTTKDSRTRVCGRCATKHTSDRSFGPLTGRDYQRVNKRFASVIEEELPDLSAPVFIQDYHLALVAPSLRALCPGVKTALFWHIPWPHPDRLRICPWRRKLLTGLLANDLLAFQLKRDRRNFIAAARDELGADVTRNTVRIGARVTAIEAVPISIDYDRIQKYACDPSLEMDMKRLRGELKIETPIVGVGVDRLDYTKGIPERLEALDLLLTRRPDLRGRLTFVQIGVPSRSTIESYVAVEAAIDRKSPVDQPAISRRGWTDPVSEVCTQDQTARRVVSSRRFLRRELAPRRYEPGGQGVCRSA